MDDLVVVDQDFGDDAADAWRDFVQMSGHVGVVGFLVRVRFENIVSSHDGGDDSRNDQCGLAEALDEGMKLPFLGCVLDNAYGPYGLLFNRVGFVGDGGCAHKLDFNVGWRWLVRLG